ncbi:DegV family protein [Proteinivorax hydrogeniformans]|uniref:DegV family protein n=1 Tax=Proteinivorax hydrogeniformans TaxID=1826727 RepID=A0AAU8HR23_9FIRM
MTSTVVVTDSGADLPESIIDELDICIVPLEILAYGQNQKDGVGLSVEQLFRTLKKESQDISVREPDIGDFLEVYQSLSNKYKNIISIHGNTTFNNVAKKATGAKEALSETKVSTIETQLFSLGLGSLVMEIAKMAKSSNKKTKLVSYANNLKNDMLTYFLIEGSDTINAKLNKQLEKENDDVANTIYIIMIKSGKVEVVDCFKNRPKALEGLSKLAQSRFLNTAKYKVAISYGDCLNDALKLRESLEGGQEYHELILSQVGAATGAHLGPKALGITTYPV